MAVKDPLIGTRIGGYLVVDLVGCGGMGAVYRARDEKGGRDVALKVLPFDLLDDVREAERFRREAEEAARFDHPNIVTVYAARQEEGCLYMAMELVEGESVRQLLRRETRLSLEQGLAIAAQVLSALQAAHDRGVVHRDIKAENVLLQADGTAQVLDFGVAKLDSGTVLTRTNEILGTVEYMAPEQILGDEVSPATDLYAVGVLLYEMLTGALPFSGDSPATLVYHQLNEDPRPPSFINPAVPRVLDRLMLQLLNKAAENRPGSASAALEDLEPIRQRQQLFDLPSAVPEASVEEGEEMRTRDFRPRFVGRRQELTLLRGYFDALVQGGRAVFLAGEAGIGKTRLAEELARYAKERRGRVVRGACFCEHGLGPYMPVLDALSELFSKVENGLTDAERAELVEFMTEEAPELAQVAAHGTNTARVRAGFAAAFGTEKEAVAARQRLFDTVSELLVRATADRPLVLVLEDMHWADEGSLQLLQYLNRRLSETQVLCVVTYRPEELAGGDAENQPLNQVLRELDKAGMRQEIALKPLDRQAMPQLAASLFLKAEFSEEFGDFLFAQSEGNPFIAVEVLKLLCHQDTLYCESGVWTVREGFDQVAIPDRVNALVMRRIDPLTPELREILEVAAVIGERFTSRMLEKACGLSRIPLLKALFRLEKQHRLIVAEGGEYDFSHAKIREVLYEEIPWELRAEYHQMVAAILEERLEEGQIVDAQVLGRHLYEAEEFGRALPYLERAAEEVFKLFDWRRSAALCAMAEEAVQRSGGPVEILVRVLRRGGLAHERLTCFDRALEKFAAMRRVTSEQGRWTDEAEAWILLGRSYGKMQRFSEADDAYAQALACLDGHDDAFTRGRALLNWGTVDFECGRYDAAEGRWQEAWKLLGQDPDEDAQRVLSNLALLATIRGRYDEAWELHEQVLASEVEDAPSVQTIIAYWHMGMLRTDQERWDEALELYARSLDICRQIRCLIHQPAIELNRAEALIGKGNLVEGRQACSQALRGFRRLDDALGVADSLRLYGRICRIEREWEESRGCLEKSIELNRQFGESINLGEALFEMGLLSRDKGQRIEALPPLHEAARIFTQAQASPDLERVQTTLEELEAA